MLTDLILKELEENFDTTRFSFDIIFDDAHCFYGTDILSYVKEVSLEAQENSLNSKHATIYIRDNTQSYIYDYDVEKDTLTRSDEESLYPPLLKLDEQGDKQEKYEKELYKELLKTLIVGSIPFAMGIIFFLPCKTETTSIFVLSAATLYELILITILVIRFATIRLHPYLFNYPEDSEDSKDMEFKQYIQSQGKKDGKQSD